MRLVRSLFVTIVATCVFTTLWAQQSLQPVGQSSAVSPLNNGIEVRAGELHERVTALRDDVLRVRLWRGQNPPEDASWAVLPQDRRAAVAVVVNHASGHAGFHTHALGVEIDPGTLEITVRDPAGSILQQDARPVRFDGDAFRIYKSMPLDEHYFGLGDKTGPFDRRNEAFTLWNTDAYRFRESNDPIYKSIPYFVTYRAGRSMGVLLDNTWRSSFDFGKESPNAYSFGAEAGPIDYYLFYGPGPKQVVETYAWLTGTPPLPPLWSLGFQQSRYSYMTQARVLEIASRLRSDRIPADAIYLDIDFQDGNRPFSVNHSTFPDLAGMIAQLKAEDFHIVMITDLHIGKYPGHGYYPYDSGMAGDQFVKNPDGSVYSGIVWPGASVFPDFTRQQTRDWWGTLYRDFRRDGADGFWNDMNEPSIFDTPTFTMPLDVVHRIDEPGFFTRTATQAEIHNVYGMENSRATYEGLLRIQPDLRPFVLTRASYAGGQRYAATWTGDNSSTWNHLSMTSPMLKSLGLSGFSFAGADVGGFAGTAAPELLTKWIEVASFQPIDRNHTEKTSGDREPWVGGAEQEKIRRRFIEERYCLMPYLYTLADETSRTGLPMMRPLFLDYPDATRDRHPIDIDPGVASEFLLGHDLLIAPSPYPEAPDGYTVEFPSADWYDFWTGERVARPTQNADPEPNAPLPATLQVALSTQVQPALDQLPVYVRAGAIVPREPLTQSTGEVPQGPLTLRVYAGDDCRGALYTDDGETFAYTRGKYLRMNFFCTLRNDGIEITISSHQGSFVPWWKSFRIEIYGWAPAHGLAGVSVQQDGQRAVIPIEQGHNFISFTVPDSGTGTSLHLE
jgi:alpha-glucosidase